MKINRSLLKACKADLRELGSISTTLIMRRYGVRPDMAELIIQTLTAPKSLGTGRKLVLTQ